MQTYRTALGFPVTTPRPSEHPSMAGIRAGVAKLREECGVEQSTVMLTMKSLEALVAGEREDALGAEQTDKWQVLMVGPDDVHEFEGYGEAVAFLADAAASALLVYQQHGDFPKCWPRMIEPREGRWAT